MPNLPTNFGLPHRRPPRAIVGPAGNFDRLRLPDWIDGIFSGGGALGTAYVGVIRAVSDHGYRFNRVAGTSAGSIIASLLAAGYSAEEAEWLTAPSSFRLDRPPTLPPQVEAPIELGTFLDAPKSPGDISQKTKEATLLWRALDGKIFDHLLATKLNVPTRAGTAEVATQQLVSALPLLATARDQVYGVLLRALAFLPTDRPRLADFIPEQVEVFRRTFVAAAWSEVASALPGYLAMVNWLHEGGVFEGDAFLRTMRHLLEAKLHPGMRTPVRFRDLPRELVVVSVDATTTDPRQRLQVYAKSNPATQDVEVALAARESMAIPLIFDAVERRVGRWSNEFMDGGMISNYPFWIFADEGHDFIESTTGEREAPKMGFILDETIDAPAQWGCPAPKFLDSQGRARIPSALEALAENEALDLGGGPDLSALAQLPGVERLIRVGGIFMDSEMVLNRAWRDAARATWPYHEAVIPLMGYHGLDFTNARQTWLGMVDRGWQSGLQILREAGLVQPGQEKPNPYREAPYR